MEIRFDGARFCRDITGRTRLGSGTFGGASQAEAEPFAANVKCIMLRVATGLLLLSLLPLFADEREKPANDAPDFQEVYDLLRAHLAGATEAELNRTAVQ